MNESIKVLLVDDEDQFRATTKRILDKRGFETLVAATGEQALTMIKEKPDVVILDIKMPGISGHEVLNEIKKDSPETPVIMLTGHGALPSAEKAKDQGGFRLSVQALLHGPAGFQDQGRLSAKRQGSRKRRRGKTGARTS